MCFRRGSVKIQSARLTLTTPEGFFFGREKTPPLL